MLYDPENARGAMVCDVEAHKELRRVVTLDTETGVVTMHHDPVRLNADRTECETYTMLFDSIYPIFGGRTRPVLFHCYGRRA